MSIPSLHEKEKADATDRIEGVPTQVFQQEDSHDLAAYEIEPHETRSLLRTLDMRIAPVAMILYLIAFLDRANIGNAAVGGMLTDLNFPDNGLSVATSIFYVTYVVFETPMATMLRTLRPSRMIPACVFVWGIVVLGNGFAQNYPTVIACRLLLGICEACLFPCLVLYLTTFYQREELALRMCYLFISAAISGVVGGLIAAGFLKMDGIGGIRGWRWLYIIEGILTALVGIGAFFAIADKYTDAKYLTERQMFLMHVRSAKAAEYSKDEGLSWGEVRKAATDPIVYLSGFIQLCYDVCLYGFSTFLVVIVRALGFDTIASQGLTAPVYTFAALVYLFAAIASDKYSRRYWLIFPIGWLTVIGYAMLLGTTSTGAQLAACFLAGAGIYLAVGLHITWFGQNMAGFRKRSTAVGMQQTMGNIGGVIAGQIYRTPDKPRYLLGHGASMAFFTVGLIAMTVEFLIWRSRNAHRERMTAEDKEAIDAKGITGDHHYNFRYVL